MNKYRGFHVGEQVIGDWFEGEIEAFETDPESGEVYAIVSFETQGGGGRLPFTIDELSHSKTKPQNKRGKRRKLPLL